jgi:predicted kinase
MRRGLRDCHNVRNDNWSIGAFNYLAQQRVTDRKGDASDATATVVERQFAYDLGHIDWERR